MPTNPTPTTEEMEARARAFVDALASPPKVARPTDREILDRLLGELEQALEYRDTTTDDEGMVITLRDRIGSVLCNAQVVARSEQGYLVSRIWDQGGW